MRSTASGNRSKQLTRQARRLAAGQTEAGLVLVEVQRRVAVVEEGRGQQPEQERPGVQ